jgi:hypothetical protein
MISKNNFQMPPAAYRPWTRWWWPGGAVEHDELMREVRMFADRLFGGIEIQPFTAGINRETLKDHSAAIYDYDSPAYYQKLVAVLEEAKALGIQVDLTLGTGWPAGGTFVPLEDNVDTLLYGEATVTRAVDMPVPAPVMPFAYALFSPKSVLPILRGREWTQTLSYHPEAARLVALVAAKIVDNQRNPDPSVLTDTMHLDINSIVDITQHVRDGHIQWEPPASGEWQIIAIYTMPTGSHTLISALTGENYVTDPFDTSAIIDFYENWIGKHPKLLSHAGATLRALFSDSYEYFPQRHFADDFLETFRANRGYDITPFLPAVFQPGRDQHFFFFAGMRTAPDFSFGAVSQRIIYDYDLTVSDLFFKHWYPASRDWIERHNLQFRQQGYNPPLDVMKAAGAASIPETEGGSLLMLKRVASGGHLYGRPLITAEAFVFFPQGGFALTPQDYRQGIDQLMSAGVNQVIYHGTPYRWDAPGYGEIGWSPFISPHGPINITGNFSEADPFWKFQREVNLYAARLQVLLQSGEPDADVLVYLPVFANPADPRFTPVVQTLDASGYAWEWVNDDLLSQAEWGAAGLRIGEMTFQGLILPDIVALPLSTAEKLAALAQAGLPIAVYGQQPSQQPGYLNFEVNDRLVAQHIETVVDQPPSTLIPDTDALAQFVSHLPAGPIGYETNPALQIIRRKLGDGKHLAFIRSTSAEPTHFTLKLDPSLSASYWLEAAAGHISAASANGWLPGFGSIAILCSPEPIFSADDLTPRSPVQAPLIRETIPLTDWQLEISGEDVPGGLGDWSQREDLQYVSSAGMYTTTVTVSEIQSQKRYLLDLGAVHSAAEVSVNGQFAGHTIFSPYQVDASDYLTSGDNRIVIEVTPPLHNRLLGKALQGDPDYAQFLSKGMFGRATPIPSGLVGPVNLQIIE